MCVCVCEKGNKESKENKEMERKKSMWFGLRGQHPPPKSY